jgi:catechol 2,3-dioxygenase-like lactoylglutathione lyase family enzyme
MNNVKSEGKERIGFRFFRPISLFRNFEYAVQPMKTDPIGNRGASRRSFIAGIGAVACAELTNASVWGQSSVPALPLKNLGLEHLDILVPDTAASAQIYTRVFKTKLHQQSFQGTIRYFILLGDLPQNRQVGYIAIGAAGTRPTSIGHYCALAERYDRAGVAKELEAAGFSAGLGGGFGMLPDPDGLELQLFQPPAGLVTAAVLSPLPVDSTGLVTPMGVDHVLLHVADIEKSLPYYHLVYGANIKSTRQTNPDRLWFQLEANTRIGLQKVPSGQKPRIDHYCIKVASFDREAVAAGIRRIGLKMVPSPDEPEVLRFLDNDGITVELKPA